MGSIIGHKATPDRPPAEARRSYDGRSRSGAATPDRHVQLEATFDGVEQAVEGVAANGAEPIQPEK
jgi:hypothetical protein